MFYWFFLKWGLKIKGKILLENRLFEFHII